MATSLIIVDDFLDHAQEVREAGLRLCYPAARGNFPGRNSAQAVDLDVDEEVSRLVGEPLVPAPGQAHGQKGADFTPSAGLAQDAPSAHLAKATF